jgi:hypothetical protein
VYPKASTLAFFHRKKNNNKPSNAIRATAPTPAPMPAFAPVDSPDTAVAAVVVEEAPVDDEVGDVVDRWFCVVVAGEDAGEEEDAKSPFLYNIETP